MSDELIVFVPSPRTGKTGRPLPFWGLNDIMQADKTSGKRPDTVKLAAERHIARIVARAMREQGWERPEVVEEWLTFVEPHGIRDEDNVYGGAKYINDALCTPDLDRRVPRHVNGCSAIWDDNRHHISRIHLSIAEETDRDSPGVWVRLRKVEDYG